MAIKSSLLWETATGRAMIRLNEGGKCATVLISESDPAELRELAKAALEAADQIDGFAADAAEVRKPK
jgi:hypothetical protein